MTFARGAFLAGCLSVVAVGPAVAQTPDPTIRPRPITLSAGVVTSSGYAVGDRSAELRRNLTGAPEPFTLFRAESDLAGAAGFEARVGYALTRRLAVELGGSLARPTLGISISEDREAASQPVVTEQVSQYTVEVSGLFHLPMRLLGRRARPYLIGGAGYLRQLHEDRLQVETGRIGYGGGGIQFWARGASGSARPLGVRGETCYVYRTGGIDFEDRGRGFVRLSVLGFIGF